MAPVGTSLALSRSTQTTVGHCERRASRIGVSSFRFFFRVSRFWNRGSVFSSASPSSSQSASHCSCLFAAMFTQPSRVRKVRRGRP